MKARLQSRRSAPPRELSDVGFGSSRRSLARQGFPSLRAGRGPRGPGIGRLFRRQILGSPRERPARGSVPRGPGRCSPDLRAVALPRAIPRDPTPSRSHSKGPGLVHQGSKEVHLNVPLEEFRFWPVSCFRSGAFLVMRGGRSRDPGARRILCYRIRGHAGDLQYGRLRDPPRE